VFFTLLSSLSAATTIVADHSSQPPNRFTFATVPLDTIPGLRKSSVIARHDTSSFQNISEEAITLFDNIENSQDSPAALRQGPLTDKLSFVHSLQGSSLVAGSTRDMMSEPIV
jgi:hypothetical protein